MRECECSIPNPRVKPGRQDWCERCGYYINPEWTSNDATTAAFYTRLAEASFPYDATEKKILVPDEFQVFRVEAEARERAGRAKFGHKSLGRDNLHDAREEAADGANYYLFRYLQAVRAEGPNAEIATALRGARHFYEAYRNTFELRRDQEGYP